MTRRTVMAELQERADAVLTRRFRSGVADEMTVVLSEMQAFYSTTDAETAKERREELATYLSVPLETAIRIDQCVVGVAIRRSFEDVS